MLLISLFDIHSLDCFCCFMCHNCTFHYMSSNYPVHLCLHWRLMHMIQLLLSYCCMGQSIMFFAWCSLNMIFTLGSMNVFILFDSMNTVFDYHYINIIFIISHSMSLTTNTALSPDSEKSRFWIFRAINYSVQLSLPAHTLLLLYSDLYEWSQTFCKCSHWQQ